MESLNTKYYEGFEGYPEIQFIRVSIDGQKEILSLWDGYFDSIMYAIEPKESCWTGIAYYFHLDQPWFDESPWKIPDVDIVIEQFENIQSLDTKTQEVLNDIIKLLRRAKTKKEEVWIIYD